MSPKAEIVGSAHRSNHWFCFSSGSFPISQKPSMLITWGTCGKPSLQLERSLGTPPADICHSWNAGPLHPQTNFWMNWGYFGSSQEEASVLVFTLVLLVQEQKPKNTTYPEQQPGYWCCQAISGSLDHHLLLFGPRGYTRDEPPMIQASLTNHWSSQISSFAWVTTC